MAMLRVVNKVVQLQLPSDPTEGASQIIPQLNKETRK